MSERKFTFSFSYANPVADRIIRIPKRPPAANIETPDEADPLWRLVGKNEAQSKNWRGHVGTFIAQELDLDVSKPWHLDDWPPGYTFWEKRRADSLMNRRDFYLYGYGGKGRFSSPQEFAFHAVWMYDDEYYNNGKCQCILCTRRKQGEINEQWFGIPRKGGRPQTGRASSQPAKGPVVEIPHRRTNTSRMFRWVVNKGGLITKNTQRSPDTPVAAERDADLLSLRPFRTGELVWVSIPALVPTGRRQSGNDEVVDFWPGLIREHHIQPKATKEGVKQPRVYYVHLLAVGMSHVVQEEQIISWQSFNLPDVIRKLIRNPTMPVDVGPKLLELEDFHPLPLKIPRPAHNTVTTGPDGKPRVDIPRTFENALGPLGVAYSQAKRIAKQYNLTDKYTDPSEPGVDRYQGVWWGPERIWLHDLVRLEFTREELVKEGLGEGLYETSEGAESNCIFVQIVEIFFKSELPALAGRLYELAAEGDAESDPEPIGDPQPSALSAPAHSRQIPYRLPVPPAGFRFRAMTSADMRICLPFQTVAGRYDPLLNHSDAHRALLARILNQDNLVAYNEERPLPPGIETGLKRILAIMGLRPGADNVVMAQFWVHGRQKGCKDAEYAAKKEYWEKSTAMDIDGGGRSRSRASDGFGDGPRSGSRASGRDVVMSD